MKGREGILAVHTRKIPMFDDVDVAVLARGTRPDAASATGYLEALETLAAEMGEGPALIVVGEAVAHSDPWLAALAARALQEIAA